MAPGNVLRFPNGGGRSAQEWGVKLYAAVFYLILAAVCAFVLPWQSALTLVLLLGLLYHFGFRRTGWQRSGYWRQNGWLLVIVGLLLVVVFQNLALPILLFAVLYWVLVGRYHAGAPHFTRFHILTALVLNGLLVLALLLVNAVMAFLRSLSGFLHVNMIAAPVFGGYGLVQEWGFPVLFMGFGVYLAVAALRGQTPYLPLVTPNVRVWV